MSDVDRYFHEVWLGMVQPIDGLVVSIPVLVDAQCMERQPSHVQRRMLALCDEQLEIVDLARFLSELLGLRADLFATGDSLPDALSLYVPEGRQTLRPTMALRQPGGVAGYEMLIWDLPPTLDLDRPESVTGTWDYPPSAKFDRLLRHCRVPIGLLTNRRVLRLVYAPHGESSGAITFRIEDMASVGGRPILDAFVMLLSANRFFGVSADRALPALLAESRTRQANVTNELADQVFEALQILLRGFEAAAERDGGNLLDDALGREGDHLYKGLLTVLLRLVFLLYAEDRALLPVEQPVYASHFSALALFEQLQADRGAYPDSMSRRFGAWGRLVALFRAVFLGCAHGDLRMPPRRGTLFNPHEYPFLEGWGPGGGAPITLPESRAEVRLPTVDDETVFRVLEKLLVLDGQRLSYRALDVEQIGSVYEALMGYHVQRMPAQAVCMRPDRLWVTADEVLAVPLQQRVKWLKETVGISVAQAEKLNSELHNANTDEAIDALSKLAAGRSSDPTLSKARMGQLVLQPGTERRRTSSHYTPRSLSAPIVRRTLEPLLAVMGDSPSSERILNLKVCDPAMGSGAFLVEACRFLADHVIAAWTREGIAEDVATSHGDPLLHARRLVAQRCPYGVDKNDAAVELAKMSLWLVTLSRTLPFTFLDHCLRHGDSLVGLDFAQIRTFHWRVHDEKPSRQLELFGREIAVALDEAIQLRQLIGTLGDTATEDREKARLFWDAQDALDRIRLIGDLVIGAFFAHDNEKDRETERARREKLVREWLLSGGPPTVELVGLQRELREQLPVFHWMVEFPEVFYAERPDPLEEGEVNRAAYMDGFIGNPPFAGKNALGGSSIPHYIAWLLTCRPDAHGNADVCAHFFRRAVELIGRHGTVGFIGPVSIAEGDTRSTGLRPITKSGVRIFSALRNCPWPGDADVRISVVHLAAGNPILRAAVTLDGQVQRAITSRLREGDERDDPQSLGGNAKMVFVGSMLGGNGFELGEEEARQVLAESPAYSRVVRRLLGGEQFNESPTQESSRYVIDFGGMTLDEARRYATPMHIVETRVRPDRIKNTRASRRDNWWMFSERSVGLYEAIGRVETCVAVAQSAKHTAFSLVPAAQVFTNTIYVFPTSQMSIFAVLQSRIHLAWVALLTKTHGGQGTVVRYRANEVVSTFPFPRPDPHAEESELEEIGGRLHDSRGKYMRGEKVGLTIVYDRIKDPDSRDTKVLELRRLHEQMDGKVLEAYGWGDIDLPPLCPVSDEDKKNVKKFEEEVIDRLFALNEKRAEQEKVTGVAPTAGNKQQQKKKPGKKVVKGRRRTTKDGAQLPLGVPKDASGAEEAD